MVTVTDVPTEITSVEGRKAKLRMARGATWAVVVVVVVVVGGTVVVVGAVVGGALVGTATGRTAGVVLLDPVCGGALFPDDGVDGPWVPPPPEPWGVVEVVELVIVAEAADAGVPGMDEGTDAVATPEFRWSDPIDR